MILATLPLCIPISWRKGLRILLLGQTSAPLNASTRIILRYLIGVGATTVNAYIAKPPSLPTGMARGLFGDLSA